MKARRGRPRKQVDHMETIAPTANDTKALQTTTSAQPVSNEQAKDAKDTGEARTSRLEARVDKLAGLMEQLLQQRSFGDALKQVAAAPAPAASAEPRRSRRLVSALHAACGAGESSSELRAQAPVRSSNLPALTATVVDDEEADDDEAAGDAYDAPQHADAASASAARGAHDPQLVQDMLDNVQECHGGSFVMWLENASGLAAKDQRAYHEVRTLCQALDMCVRMGIFSPTSPLVELLCRRVLGVHMAVMMGNWALCDAVALKPTHNILASQHVVAEAVRTASRQLSLASRTTFNRSGRGRSRGRGRGNGSTRGRGRQGREGPSFSSAKSAAEAAAATGAGAQ